MHPMACLRHSMEVFILHLGVVLAVPPMVLLIIVAALPPIDILYRLMPLLAVALSERVVADVIIPLECQQRQVHSPSVLPILLGQISLQQRPNVLRKSYFIDLCMDCRNFLSEVDPGECLEHVAGALEGGVVADGVGGDVDEDDPIHKGLNVCRVVPLGELHQCQCPHRVPNQSQMLPQILLLDVLKQVVSQVGHGMCGGVRTVSMIPGIDEV